MRLTIIHFLDIMGMINPLHPKSRPASAVRGSDNDGRVSVVRQQVADDFRLAF